MPRKKIFYFKKDFLFGASLSGHQAEGGSFDDWSIWEKKNAKRLSLEAEAKFGHLRNWPEIKKAATSPQNYISGQACDFWHKFEDDFNLAKSLGLNALRLSIEWSRVEPKKGEYDLKAIKHYLKMINSLQRKKIEPFVTLWHFTLPAWAAKMGGFKNSMVITYFCRYVKKIALELKGRVKFIVTINEPEVYAAASYYQGVWPPQEKNFISYFIVLQNLISAHKKSYKILKKISKKFKISIAKNNVEFVAEKNNFFNRLLKRLADWWWNFYILNQIKNQIDYLGVNHYFRNLINRGFNRNPNAIVSGLGFELYPRAIYRVLLDLKKYNKPIYILENGLADTSDSRRGWFLSESLRHLHRAIHQGVMVRGYLHWSLIDNFEWDKGFWPRFGLIGIDYGTLARRVRPSAYLFSKIIADRALFRPKRKTFRQKKLIKI